MPGSQPLRSPHLAPIKKIEARGLLTYKVEDKL